MMQCIHLWWRIVSLLIETKNDIADAKLGFSVFEKNLLPRILFKRDSVLFMDLDEKLSCDQAGLESIAQYFGLSDMFVWLWVN